MGPIRRYLRITKYSVVEVRIYLDDPSIETTWLLNPRDAALPRVMQAVRPFILPKLREENARVQGKGKKKKGVKDIFTGDDFEVSIFLTDQTSTHALLTKTKTFEARPDRIKSNSRKLTDWLGEGKHDDESSAVRIESDDEEPDVNDFPAAGEPDDISEDEGYHGRNNSTETNTAAAPSEDDKKKLKMRTTFEGFSIYGKIVCLVVKRRKQRAAEGQFGQHMLETWVGTQAAAEPRLGDGDAD